MGRQTLVVDYSASNWRVAHRELGSHEVNAKPSKGREQLAWRLEVGQEGAPTRSGEQTRCKARPMYSNRESGGLVR